MPTKKNYPEQSGRERVRVRRGNADQRLDQVRVGLWIKDRAVPMANALRLVLRCSQTGADRLIAIADSGHLARFDSRSSGVNYQRKRTALSQS